MALTKAHSRMIEGSPLNVIDFGADPTGVSDSTSSIQAAIDAAETRPSAGKSATVYIPAGTYLITDTINVNKDVRVTGDGGDATIINLSVSTAKEAFRLEPASGGYIWFAGFDNFRVNCKAGSVAGDGFIVTATSPSAVSQSYIRDVQIRDFRDGITFAGISANEVYINTIQNVKMVGAALSAGANDVRYGLKVSTSVYNTFSNIEITNVGNAGYAVFCEGAGSHFFQITTDGVSYVDSPWGVLDDWAVETIQCTTPVSTTVLSVSRIEALRAVSILAVENAKCQYAIGIASGSTGMTISDVTVDEAGTGNKPNYPITLPPGSKGTIINWKGAGAFLVEAYTDASYVENWRFINSLDITDREVGVRNVASGAKPTASAGLRGQLVLEKAGAGAADAMYVCRKNASEVYEWHAIY